MADSKLKEFPAGKRFLNSLENGTINVLRWRAESDADLDMAGIKRILLVSSTILFIVALIMTSNGMQLNIYFVLIFLVNILLFSSVQWFLDIKKETIKMVGFMAFLIASPWLMHLLGESAEINPSFIDIFREQFRQFGFTYQTDYQFLGILSLMFLICSAMMLGFWILMVTIPSIVLFWLIKFINKASLLLVGVEKQKIQLFFVGVNILVPIWFFAKDRIA